MSGVAIAYNPIRKRADGDPKPSPGRPQGSLYSQQRRKIADATEYMRRYGRNKPLIFCLTSPGFTDLANERPLVSKWINNMRMRHGMLEYVWVRELTGNGYPHFHFVADVPRFDPVAQSRLWSSYFGSDKAGSIHLGTKPKWNGHRWVRKYYVDSLKMAFYMSKYIGKGIDDREKYKNKRIKNFFVSHKLGQACTPAVYTEEVVETITGKHSREWVAEQAPDWLETEGYINPAQYSWKQPNELHNVFIGYRKK